jgi:hypothetical protein
MKDKITEIKNEIRQKRALDPQPPSPGRQFKIPVQYPKAALQVNAMLASIYNDGDEEDENSDEGSTDDEAITSHIFHATMTTDLEVKAHLELVDNYSGSNKIYAILDGGADSCVLGMNAEVVSYTGRYATLVGYDPKHTKSKRIPIVTAYIKVMAQNGIPVLLKINEAVYNEGSPITLLSEYQIREFGYVIDSVAEKHNKALGEDGTQRLTLNEVVHIPFQDRGGIMGFEMLPIEAGEIDEIDPILDIFELTGPKPWIPARFRNINMGTSTPEGPTIITTEKNIQILEGNPVRVTSTPTVDLIDSSDSDDSNPKFYLPAWIKDISFAGAAKQLSWTPRTKPWHQVQYPDTNPEILRKFLGWRPVDIIKKTLEHTTQLAKTAITYPLQRHFKARNPFSNVHRLNEVVSTDPIFANCRSIDNSFEGAQIFFGLKSHCINVYGFKLKGEFPRIYKDFIREEGAPSSLRRDNAKEEQSWQVQDIQRTLYVKDEYSEAYNPQQNPVEGRAIRWLKMASHSLLDKTGTPDTAWYFAIKYLADVHNITYDPTLNTTPYQKRHIGCMMSKVNEQSPVA